MRTWLAAAALLAALPSARAATVEIHPAGPTVPENLLRIELRFAQPQRLPFDIERVKLLDADGRQIEHALLDLALPSADGRRITVLMDPGRVKSGVGPNRDAGRALHAGETVRLQVDDPTGVEAPAVKAWQVTTAASRPLDISGWQLNEPRVGSRDALVVDLRAPISSSGEPLIAVVDATGRRVPGTTSLAEGDAVWRFTPARPWASGPHRLVAHADLEDPAGNRRCAAFEQVRESAVRCDADASLNFLPQARR
ncbi:hypothetical protein ACG04R_21380 [Roseateles sp. BYS78W]|uniref:Ig-like domain-containing protein n=1 Tax=Pelomonas candidula TaxID=3299025 RepID=A0ABW7HHB6_9BURK